MKKYILNILHIVFICIFQCISVKTYSQSCDPNTPTFTFDLSGNPDSIWISPNVVREGLCCGLDPTAKPPIRCIEFFFTLDSEAEGIRFDIASGAIPPGALGYQINCGPVHQVGENICLSGPGPHRLTFCKPGNNPNTYSITSIAKPKVSAPTVVSDACTGILNATGYNVASIQWTSVPFNATYNSYLSCTSACSTTNVTYQTGAPAFIDYQVSGFPIGGCSLVPVTNTTRVYFVNDKSATIQPQDPVVCFGGTTTSITANGTGGAPPYKYLWNTGATTQSIDVGVGTYWVEVYDSTSCPHAYDTVTVTAFLSPITADAGPDVFSCVNNPSIVINGSVFQATGGIWSGGNGTYSPDNTSLSITYTPTAAEITATKATLILTTTGNRNCPPSTDTTVLKILPSPLVNAGADRTICSNNSNTTLNGSIVNAGGGTWSGGTGVFSPDANTLNASYTPSATEISNGTVTLTLTSTGNGTCNPVSDQMVITITPAPVVNAGPDQPICFNKATAPLNGTVSAAASGGTWSGGSGTFSPNKNTLNTSYIPSAAEKTTGSVTLTLTSTGNGNCIAVSDPMIISITPAPTANAGPAQSICANNASAILAGSVTTATGGTWIGGAGVFVPNRNTQNATYTPSASEITNGSVTLTLSTTGNGNCNVVTDKVILTVTPAPTVNAGPDRTVCANNSSLNLSGSVTIATGGTWSGGTGVFSPNANTLNASYTPSATEVSNGTVSLTLTTTGNGTCNPVSDQMIITITPSPVVNAGPDQPICFNNATAILNGIVSAAATGGVWSGGTGTFSPDRVTLNASYIPTAAEKTAGTVTLTLTSTGNGNCIAVSDPMIISITPTPTANAGPAQSICANNASALLAGSVTTATGGTWIGGVGVFTPDRNTLTATYTPSASEITNGSVTLTLSTTGNGNCIAVTDKVTLNITPAPTVNAGADQSVCKTTTNITLNGTVFISSGGSWSTSGTGTFSPDVNILSADYLPSEDDTTAGIVTIVLTTTGNGNCLAVSDTMLINFSDIPVVNAGPDQTVCTNSFPIQLNASGNPGIWSNGGGTFNPSPSTANATYTPSSTEISTGSVTLTYTSILNGACTPLSDDVTITIPPGPVAIAGSSTTVCADTSGILLNGSVLVATEGIWSTSGTGTFTPDPTALNATYVPSDADTSAGSVTLTLTSTGYVSCNPPATDQIVVTITPAPTVNAGPDQTICADATGLSLNGFASVATSGIWTTSGTGTFSKADTLTTTYTPSPGDTAAHMVTLKLTTTENGSCRPVSDNLLITITPEPIINAGIDQTVCSDSQSASLHGSVFNATGGVWSSSGTGIFSPNANTLNALYYPSSGDRTTGTVNLTLTSTGNGNCNAVAGNSLILSITPAPTADAGADQIVCADTSGISLNGSITTATRAKWSTSGTGTFAPNDSALNAAYIPSSNDIITGTVSLTLTTIGNENCINVSDQITITITPVPMANAGSDQTVCANNSTFTLNGSVTIASGGTWTQGSGTYSPNENNLNALYTPSNTEINNGSATLVLTTTGNGSCKSVSDTMILAITPAPIINAGTDQVLCMDQTSIALTGTVSVSTGGAWTSSGTGTFSPNPDLLNTTYNFSAADQSDTTTIVITSTGNGNCLAVKDTVLFTFSNIPTADAGPVSTCSDSPGVQLNGTVTVATTGIWTSSGTGTFSPSSNTLNPIYTPSPADKTSLSVKLKLTATTCKSISDSIILYITPAPIANAAADQTVCANKSVTTLAGSVNNANGGIWISTGSGTFSPNQNTLNADYSPSAADVVKGFATIVLTSTGNGNCKAAADTMIINITPSPTANAGADKVVCADIAGVSLSGVVTVASGGTWLSSGSGTFSPNADNLTTIYAPSVSDINSGSVNIILTTTGNNLCNPVTDNMIITITPAPVANAGPDQTACEDVDAVAFYGSVSVASGGHWVSTGLGTFSDPNQLPTIYNLAAADKISGSVKLTLTTTGNGTCNPVSDTTILFLTNLPTANPGIDQTVCNNNTGVILNGSVNGASGGTWTTSGSGTFSPSPTQLNGTYTPTPSDTTQGLVTLTLTTNVIGGCAVYDTMNIIFIDPKLNLPDHYCFENNLLIDSDPYNTSPSGFFNWFKNDTLLAMENNSTLTVNQRGIYKVSYTFDQCSVFDSTNITLPQPLISQDKLICEGGSTTISTSIIPLGIYEWKHQGNIVGGNSNSLALTDDGDSIYIVTVVDSLLCQISDTVYVNTIPPPILTLSNIPSCIGETETMNATPANVVDPNNSKYTWHKNEILLNDTTATIAVNSTGIYSVIYSLGECMAYDTAVVTFNPLPTTSMKHSVYYCKESDISITLDAGPGTAYEWLATGNAIRTETVLNPGSYKVKVFNQYNCYTIDSIAVRDVCPPRLFVPTIFSPNGDGKNDRFDISGYYFKNYNMTIFNRWGEIIFYTEDRNISWDGTYRGEPMPIGVYAWIVNYEGEFNEYKGPYKKEGSVTVNR